MGRFRTLDGLRGVAAIAVMLFHAESIAPVAMPGGYLAVDLFFVLSGFVIATAYLPKLADLGPIGFGKVRFARLYPMYFGGIVVGAMGAFGLAALGGASFEPWSALAALFLLPWPNPGHLFPTNPPAWSLFYEALVNAALAMVHRWLRPVTLLAILLVTAAALTWIALDMRMIFLGAFWPGWWHGLIRAIFSFTAGIALTFLPRTNLRLTRWWTLALPLVVLFIFAAAPADRAWLDLLSILFLFPAIVWLGAQAELPLSPLFDALGNASYPLYCIHFAPIILARASR